MFLREVVTGKKEGKPVRYAQIVESYRNSEGKSRHRLLLPLGRVDQIDPDSIRSLITSLSRYLQSGKVPESAHLGEARDFGVGYVADALWRRLRLPVFFTKQLRKRKFNAPVERALFALVVHRMVDPCSKLQCWDWLEHDAWLAHSQGIQLQHLYRVLDFLEDCHEDLEHALYAHRQNLFDKAELVYYDTTSTYFECDDPGDELFQYGLRQRGYSRDLRPDRKQIVIGLAVDQQGLPITSEVFSGDTNDALTVVPMLSRLKALGLNQVVWVADRGMGSSENLASIKAAGLSYIVGVRLRADEELRQVIHEDDQPYTQGPEGLMLKELNVGEKRMVVCFSPASAQRDLKLRTGAIERMTPVLKQVNRGGDESLLTTHGLYRRLVSRHEDGKYYLDKNKMEKEAQCDGTFVLEVSDKEMTALAAAEGYKGLLRVEQAFHGLKHGVDIRPVYHRVDKRIRAHVTLCMLAYFLERVVEIEAKQPFEQIRKQLRRIRAVELKFEKQTVWETTTISTEAAQILKCLKIPLPPRILPVSP